MSPRVSFMWIFFAGVTASRTFLSFHTTTFLIYVSKFAFTKFLWVHVFQKAVVLTFPQSTLSSTFHLCLTQTSLSTLLLLFLLLNFTFAGLFFLLTIHICKMSREFITGKQGGNTSTHFAARLWTVQVHCINRCKKWQDWSLIVLCICHLCSDLWTKELAAMFVLYTTSQWIYSVTEIWTTLLGDWYYLNCGNWNMCIWNHAK